MIDARVSYRLLVSFCVLFALACSADPKANPNYGKRCGAGFKSVRNFCVKLPSDDKDAGDGRDATTPTRDSGTDSGSDSGADAGFDAGPPEPCGAGVDVGDEGICYPAKDILTARQPPCQLGKRTCLEGNVWGDCEDYRVPKDEECNGIDDDCDATTDEAQVQRVCTVEGQLGACAENGIGVCASGDALCFQTVNPKPETCNEVDDDCDGRTDEGLERACYPEGMPGCTLNGEVYECVPASTCAPGAMRCVDGVMQTECKDATLPTVETGTTLGEAPLDEDCDGDIDEGFPCQNGATFTCYSGPVSTRGMEPCQDGTQLCTDNEFGECMNEQTPVQETCANQGTDNDCNGETDDIPMIGASCSAESSNRGLCKQNATFQCVAGGRICVDGEPSAEVCNGRNEDEDCDDEVDEGFDLQRDVNNCGSCGNRCGAGQTCCAGACVNTTSSNAHCGACGSPCGTGLTCCSSSCRNTRTDNNNCGMCGKACLLGGLLSCSNGACL